MIEFRIIECDEKPDVSILLETKERENVEIDMKEATKIDDTTKIVSGTFMIFLSELAQFLI